MADATASNRGHRLGKWVPNGAGLRAQCGRCGSTAYVRVENGMAGLAGRALSEPCRQEAAGDRPPVAAS
jgi:hypothetical protein